MIITGHHRSALRVSLSGSTDCIAPLDKGVARAGPMSAASALGLACEARLAVNPDKLTELAIIILEEHESVSPQVARQHQDESDHLQEDGNAEQS